MRMQGCYRRNILADSICVQATCTADSRSASRALVLLVMSALLLKGGRPIGAMPLAWNGAMTMSAKHLQMRSSSALGRANV